MKTKFIKILCSLFVFIVMACSTVKQSASQAEIERLDMLVKNREFKIESEWAYPTSSIAMQQATLYLSPGNSTTSISLIGNSNFLTLSGDRITSFLPYYGERGMGAGYTDDDGAIKLMGIIENYRVTKGKNGSYKISFEAKSLADEFDVDITLYPSLKTNMVLTGNSRMPIRYTGRAKLLTTNTN